MGSSSLFVNSSTIFCLFMLISFSCSNKYYFSNLSSGSFKYFLEAIDFLKKPYLLLKDSFRNFSKGSSRSINLLVYYKSLNCAMF